jgi:hypothetical protein
MNVDDSSRIVDLVMCIHSSIGLSTKRVLNRD